MPPPPRLTSIDPDGCGAGLAHAAELAEEFCFFLVEGEREFEAEMAAKLLLVRLCCDGAVTVP